MNIENDIKDTESSKDIKQIADNIISPVLVSFIWWVLTNALKNGYKKLYFLARDGYIMYRIALQFCARFDLPIECRYLYGSRLAWQTAVYHLIGDEKYKYIFSGGYFITPQIILKRIRADIKQRYDIYGDINNINVNKYKYDLSNENQALNSNNMKIFAEMLKKSRVFCEYADRMSKKQFCDVSIYLRQEKVFDGHDIVIVDSGWTGSIQRVLRQIAEFNMINMINLKITGYYFGLYTQSGDSRDGRYEAWYFSPKSPVSLMTNFNNNVLECMCASPFNMTVGYKFSENSENTGDYIPVFNDSINSDNNRNNAILLNYYIEQFTADFLNNDINDINFDSYSDTYLENSKKILHRFMINPTKKEAEVFGKFKFCDDMSGAYENTLARFADKEYLKNYTIINRFLYRVSKNIINIKKTKMQITQKTVPDLFWFHGSLAISDLSVKNQKWYRFNYKLWDTLRLVIKKNKK